MGQHPAITHVLQQFHDATAQRELRTMGPASFDWVARAEATLAILLPELPSLAERIRLEVPLGLNSSAVLADLVAEGEKVLADLIARDPAARDWYSRTAHVAAAAKAVNQHVASQQISSAIQRFVLSPDGLGSLVYGNGNSIYPDILCSAQNYGGLPHQCRKAPIDGACLRGLATPRPSNVPDGCELKTNQGQKIRVDAHGAHPGLHLGVTWDLSGDLVIINGVWVAWVRIADHRESGRNVKVTTVKFSYGHDLFRRLA